MIAAIWAVGFLVCFFCQNLPNNSPSSENAVSRWDIWKYLGADWPTVFNPFDYTSPDHQSGWQYIGQRTPFFLTAAVLLISAWCLGRVVVRLVVGSKVLYRSETLVIEFGVGLSLLTLWILACGIAGRLSPLSILLPSILAFPAVLHQFWLGKTRSRIRVEVTGAVASQKLSTPVRIALFFAFAPFVIHILIGGMTPPRDFDVREYHLQGPKEWFQAGRIETLEHNVYTSFPFLSEMLSLGAMVLTGDWWEGAIAGKLTLTAFQFLSVVCVFAIGRRWAGTPPAWIAAFALLSTPWTIRISIIAYAEGALTFYLIACLMVALIAVKVSDDRQATRLIAVTGLLAGSAMSSKYPGLLSVIVPVILFFLFTFWTKTRSSEGLRSGGNSIVRNAIVFVSMVILAVGPWLARNMIDTGNPVYPLAYSVFGSTDWNADMDAKWKRAHSAPDHNIAAIPLHLEDVAIRSDWQNGFLFAFAVPALFLAGSLPVARWLWLYTFWMLATWWSFTHRIDRFWIPVIPVLAVLAGLSWNLSTSRIWRGLLLICLAICSIFNYGFCRLPVVGFHGGLIELGELKKMPIRQDLRVLNQTLPKEARVLMVGEAEVFDVQFGVVYNTVFDESIFQQWTSADLSLPGDQQSMRSGGQVWETLRQNSVTHVYVNWSEILRYRLTYGFTKYITPNRFSELQRLGVLENPTAMSSIKWQDLTDQQQAEIRSWPGSQALFSDDTYWNNILLYRVR